MIYTLTFNPALDYSLNIDSFILGETNRSYNEDFQIGGKGINVSVILTRLGIENVALGFIAGFTGRQLNKIAEEIGIKTDFIELEKGNTRINVKLKGDTETEINASGPLIDLKALELLFEKLSLLKIGDTLVLSGSVPPSINNDIYEKILAELCDKGIRVCVDATNKLLLNALKYKPFLIKPNRFEIEQIFGETLDTDQKIINAALFLKQKGAQNVLVSLGDKGAIFVDESSKVTFIRPHKIKSVNTVGAGDSMLAGFLAGIDVDLSYALKLANAAGAATAASVFLADKKEIEKLLNL